ncbi:DEAD/DEAH box helicase domain-containing protein [Ditylenchus destructor]|uniref:RNA helicase n=1 Tax=Ditylenchus destructor TaxID=166010 RepID=A0AAD4MXA5_9BILA|nr:DEAD/DEAH box helicase domain-containing protein [Ditylenchus destructor]
MGFFDKPKKSIQSSEEQAKSPRKYKLSYQDDRPFAKQNIGNADFGDSEIPDEADKMRRNGEQAKSPRKYKLSYQDDRPFAKQNIGNADFGDSEIPDEADKMRILHRPKYMPTQRRQDQLFDAVYEISDGPMIRKYCGKEVDSNIHIFGGDGSKPAPIKSFEELDIYEPIKENIYRRNYRRPISIQRYVIPLILDKTQDIVGHANTGCGKTAAFLVPIVSIIQHLKEKESSQYSDFVPFAVLIAPTRELAQQLCNDVLSFAEGTDVKVTVCYGEMPMGGSRNRMRRDGCDIIVSTPGRFRQFLLEGIIILDRLRFLVLDEADKLFEDVFIEDIIVIKTHKTINRDHRTFMFSATFSEKAQSLFDIFVREDYFLVNAGATNSVVDTVTQEFLKVTKYDKDDLLIDILKRESKGTSKKDNLEYYDNDKTLIFVEHSRQSIRLAIVLAQEGFRVMSVSRDRTAEQRTQAIDQFIRGVHHILVSTNMTARGLNVPEVALVINYDLPVQDPDSTMYIHRIGRAGRKGNAGRAISFFDPESKDLCNAKFYVEMLMKSQQRVPKFLKEIVDKQQMLKDRQEKQMNQKKSTEEHKFKQLNGAWD